MIFLNPVPSPNSSMSEFALANFKSFFGATTTNGLRKWRLIYLLKRWK